MNANDPRHGTEAGHEQHVRDNETPCEACREAKLRAARRRSKRKTMGYVYSLPVGPDNYQALTQAREQGARLSDIADWTGLALSQVHRIIHGGPEQVVMARTWQKINRMTMRQPVTTIGVTRRIQALMWLGYSPVRIAEAAGCHRDTIRDARDEPPQFLTIAVRNGIAAAYNRLSMTPADGDTKQLKAGVARTRNRAIRCNYLPPLAWTNIDDPNDVPDPKHWKPVRAWHGPELLKEWAHLTGLGVGEDQAAKQLGITLESVEKAHERAAKADAA